MSSVSTVSISGVTYNVYGTETEIKNHLAGRLNTTAYDNASSTDRKRAHIQATRWIDREKWQGQPTDTTTPQPLEFPRTGLKDCNGNEVDDSTIPDELCAAVAELVLILLDDATAFDSASTAKNIKRAKAGSAEVEFFRAGDAQGGRGTILPTSAWKLVRCFAGSGNQSSSGSIAYGTGESSHFDDCDVYDLRQGEGYP